MMKMLAIAALASGLVSGVAAAEPVTLDNGTLGEVKGGYYDPLAILVHETEIKNIRVSEDNSVSLYAQVGGKNSSAIWQDQSVWNVGGGDVEVEQEAEVEQDADVFIGLGF